ncbi:MAG TPA: ATP-binding protein [Vicinamibacterales bacterium]|jgi:signal transduction histidine kinase|nr:ATP-binding protein [Vicinamibacterales bacterium]
MTLFSTLRSRIFMTSAMLAVLSIAAAIYLVNARVTREAEKSLEREIVSAAAQVDQLRAERTQTFTLMAGLIADLPKLKAAMSTNDPATVKDIAAEYQAKLKASLLLVTNQRAQVLYVDGGTPREAAIIAGQPAVHDAVRGRNSVSLLPWSNGILQVVTVPVVGIDRNDMIGSLSAGFLLGDALATQLKQITGSDIAFGMDGQILAATLPRDANEALAERLRTSGVSTVTIGGDDYVALPRPLQAPAPENSGPVALILRSRTEQLAFLDAIHTELAGTAIVAVALATLLSFAVARTITRPLAAITGAMRDVAATGDLTRSIALRPDNKWDDEDARLLAATFNTLTDSLGRFQREVSQRERLSSLGRLSTVIAHEVRNPLMIIKAALHTLRQPGAGAEAVREAAADIDGEVGRLNRIVNEVLDFARPIQFELGPVDLNALCRESAAAADASGPGAVTLALDEAVGTIVTDGERVRIAMVNMLVNARHAVNGHGPAGSGERGVGAGAPPLVSLTTARAGSRVTITIADRGVGIAPADLNRIFDPYFTTKRGGTGLGLPISKNIVEGLGGTLTVASVPGGGTSIRIELPAGAPADAPPRERHT